MHVLTGRTDAINLVQVVKEFVKECNSVMMFLIHTYIWYNIVCKFLCIMWKRRDHLPIQVRLHSRHSRPLADHWLEVGGATRPLAGSGWCYMTTGWKWVMLQGHWLEVCGATRALAGSGWCYKTTGWKWVMLHDHWLEVGDATRALAGSG